MTTEPRFVIVGAGLAAARGAEALRDSGFSGPITMIGDERHRPYERPPLSKDYLQGRSPREKVFVHPEGWYDEQAVDLMLDATATSLDLSGHHVLLADGRLLSYDKALVATGARPRRLTLPGAELGGVHYLRGVDDSEALRAELESASRIAIIGGGWIGLEVAAAARAAGVEVTVLEQAFLPLLQVLGPEVARVYADLHRAHDVELLGGVGVEELIGDRGRVAGVRLVDGTVVDADVVVVGVGVLPNDEIARRSGLLVDNGILVDEHLRTSHPDVFAAGDVANAAHPLLGRRVRVEHWANARHQGPAAAAAMLGRDEPYERLPYFYSDQYDLGMEYAGHIGPRGYDRVVFRGDPDSGEFLAFWLADGRVQAGMNANVWDVNDAIASLVRSGAVMDEHRLQDEAVPLSELVSPALR